MYWILAGLSAFALGSLPWGLWIGLWLRAIDVRRHGSGNLGATNVYRVLGRGPGLLVLLLDGLKGAAAVALAGWIFAALGSPDGSLRWAGLLGMTGVLFGHAFSPFASFRGGKGVAAAAGAWFALAPQATLIALCVFAIVFARTRIVSAASLSASIVLPVAVFFTGRPGSGADAPEFWVACGTALMIIVRHRSNLSRLLRREEKPLELDGRKTPEASRPSGTADHGESG